MNPIAHSLRPILTTIPLLGLIALGCEPRNAAKAGLPPAYTSNQITDPALHEAADEIQTWATRQTNAGQKPLYSRVEVLPPVPTVQPYGVGVFQQEVRLPVILTTGPGWTGMKLPEKEAAVAQAFRHISERLQALNHKPALQPTLTVQTPQGMELAWMNQLDPSGKNVHGDE